MNFFFIVKPGNVAKVFYFGNDETIDEKNGDLVKFVSHPQEGMNPFIVGILMSAINECVFLARIENPLDRLWILDNYNGEKEYSRSWVADDSQDEEMNIKQKVYLAAYSKYKKSNNPLVPINPTENCMLTFQEVEKQWKMVKVHHAYQLKCLEDEHRDAMAAKDLEIHELKLKLKDFEESMLEK